MEDVRKLAALGRTHPQVAYHLLVRSLVAQWRYTMRTTRCPAELFQPLEDVLSATFFPSVFGWSPCNEAMRTRCALPTRHGGLAIPNPVLLAGEELEAAVSLTKPLQDALLGKAPAFHVDPRAAHICREKRLAIRDSRYRACADAAAADLHGRAARAFEEARLRGGSSWLSFAPLDSLGLSLDRTAFRDAIALRMGVDLPDALPTTCPSCGSPFSLEHALECKRGGWVVRRHHEVARAWKRYFEKGGARSVQLEPVLRPLPLGSTARPSTNLADDARADLAVRSGDGRDEFYDVAVIDTGAPSYSLKSSSKTLLDYEQRKCAQYTDRVCPFGTFTPLVCSVYGTLAPAAASTAARVARGVDANREERDAVVDLHSAVLQAAVIKATALCLRARSFAVLPIVAPAGSLDDATSSLWMARYREE